LGEYGAYFTAITKTIKLPIKGSRDNINKIQFPSIAAPTQQVNSYSIPIKK
jgi:hypothetical protein